jgi:Cu/Ag efflux pump CusA
VLAVALTGGVISLGSLVGFITLFGISARNAILLVAHVDELVARDGLPWTIETVLRATRERVTPIVLTALVTAFALAPLAWESGQSGREVQGRWRWSSWAGWRRRWCCRCCCCRR